MAGLFSFSAIAVSGALALNHSGLIRSMIAKAGVQSSASYTIQATDFNAGDGTITVGGTRWHYTNSKRTATTVTLSGVLYTMDYSGDSASGGRRGNGYTRMVFNGLDLEQQVGLVYHLKDVNGTLTKTANPVSADVDLTFGGTVASSDRRGIEFAQGTGSSFTFTSLTLYYDCVDVSPEVHITETEMSVGVGETGQLHTSTVDVSEGAGETYSWASDDEDVATVDNNGLVTGVGAGSANITVTMTIGENTYTDTLEVSVTAAPATVVEMATLDTSKIEGAGIFCRFNPSSASVTAAQLDTYTVSLDVEFADTNVNNAVNHYTLQEKGDSSYTAYVVMDSVVGLNGAFTAQADFKDNANNTIYRAVWHFDNGALDTPIHLSAAGFSVNEGEDLEITASKASWLEGTPSFSFESLDNNVFTVTNEGNVATVTGGSEGSATLRVTMIVEGEPYTLDKTIAVTKAGVEHLITWYTEGTNNQRNHWDGAGVWTWVNYGALGYDWAGFEGTKSKITVSYESNPTTTIAVNVISDPISGNVGRVYLVAGAAYNTGKLTMTIPDVNGVTYTGSITFVDGEATAYNA